MFLLEADSVHSEMNPEDVNFTRHGIVTYDA